MDPNDTVRVHVPILQMHKICFVFLLLPTALGRTLIPRYFRSLFEGGVSELQINLKHFKESYHTTTVTLDCDHATMTTCHGKAGYKVGLVACGFEHYQLTYVVVVVPL